MYSLIITMKFIPLLWGDPSTSIQEVQGLTEATCIQAANNYKSYKDRDGTTIYNTLCVKKEVK